VVDSAGRTEGIGSRFFTVLNGSTADVRVAGDSRADGLAASSTPTVAGLLDAPAAVRGDARDLEHLAIAADAVTGRTGFDLGAPFETLTADAAGVRRVQMPELGRLELRLGAVERGYLVANGTLRDLPPGSRLDASTGVFTWAPGAGYIGTYRLTFIRADGQIPVDVTVRPAAATGAGESQIRMYLDLPLDGATVSGAFHVAGWALDPRAAIGSGIGAVHVWAVRVDAPGQAQFLGAAALGGARPDVAAVHGPQFGSAAFSLDVAGLPAGRYAVTAYTWSRRTARWEDARTATVTVK